MPSDPPPDRILIGIPGSAPVEARRVAKLHLTLDAGTPSGDAAVLAAELQELLPCEVSVTVAP